MQLKGKAAIDTGSTTDIGEAIARCALSAIGFHPTEEGASPTSFQMPEDLREELQFLGLAEGEVVQLGDLVDSPLVASLLQYAQSNGIALHAAPTSQPGNVHEMTQPLFEPYTFNEGAIHLGGCTLEDRPLLMVSLAAEGTGESVAVPRQTLFLHSDGQVVADDLVDALQLKSVSPYEGRPPRMEAGTLEMHWQQAEQGVATSWPSAPLRIEALLIVWCKFAEGKIIFEFNDATAEVAFSGWARLLADGVLCPPPLKCAESAVESYHVAVTDDGRVTAAEAIARCSVSRRRCLAVEMEPCAITGQLALPGQMVHDPLTGSLVIASALAECGMCGQAVSPKAIRSGRCTGCRKLKPTEKSDPRMARLLGEYPGLDVWRKWKLSETSRDYLLLATTLWRQLLVVVDKSTLELRRAASTGRFSKNFSELPQHEQKELFGK